MTHTKILTSLEAHACELFTLDEDAETIDYTSIGDAIGEYIDTEIEIAFEADGTPYLLDPYAHDIVDPKQYVYCYVREKINAFQGAALADRVLETLLEQLDEEYGDPEGLGTEPTIRMKEKATAFVDAVLEEYQVWSAKLVGKIEVDLIDWMKENEPEKLVLEE